MFDELWEFLGIQMKNKYKIRLKNIVTTGNDVKLE